MSRKGFTLIELLIILAVLGILFGLSAWSFHSLGKSRAYTGYVSAFGQAVEEATTQANETNTIYALEYDQDGFKWGSLGGTLKDCETSEEAPTLVRVVASHDISQGVSVDQSGWFCFSAPGLVYRLKHLSTCQYKTYDLPCLTFSGPGRQEQMFVSIGGRVKLQ